MLDATGHAGIELLRVLVQNPRVRETVVSSQQFVGRRLSEIYPSLQAKCDLVLKEIRTEELAPEIREPTLVP